MTDVLARPARPTGIGSHHSPAMGTDRWLTPAPIVEALGTFDLDPCGAPGHELATETWTPEAGIDGLERAWHGRAWVNPPYGRETAAWLAKLADHGTGTALIFARTETAMWFEHVWPEATAILFLKGRLHFLHPDGTRASANAGAPSALIAYGPNDARALGNSGIAGQLVELQNTGAPA